MDAGKYAALDYETLYSTKDGYTLTNMTAYQYVHDPRFNPYLLAVCYGDGRPDYVGTPEGFDWESLRGLTCLAHNASFDSMVTARLRELGKVPADIALDWLDTADLTAYLGVQRNLKSACKYLLGKEISKQVRSDMDGKLPCNLNSQELRDLYEYGASDARECLEIFLKYGDRWPEVERAISNQNRIACQDGFHVDRDAVVKGIEILRKVQDRAAEKLPWVNCEDPSQRRPAGSIQALAEEVRRAGVTPPSSFKKDDPGFLEWNEKYADQFPFIKARLEHAGTVQHIARLETLLAQLDSNDLVRPGLVYFGAHSGRFTAGVGAEQKGAKNVNMLNLPRKPVYGVDMRGMYIPRDGYRFVIFDYSQIEARATLWLAGDTAACEMLRDPNANLYEMIAARQGWCSLGDDIKHTKPDLYRVAKAQGLGLSYGLGAWKFVTYCKGMGIDLEAKPRGEWPDLSERRIAFMLKNVCNLDPNRPADEHKIGQFLYSKDLVDLWRRTNPLIASYDRDPSTGRAKGLWKQLEDVFVNAANARKDSVTYILPSGREKTYWSPHYSTKCEIVTDPVTGVRSNRVRRELTATAVRGQSPKYFNGGKITENLIQSLCRDIMTYGAVEIERRHPTWKFRFSVYDEVIFEVPYAEVDTAIADMPEIMCRGELIRDWTKGLPLAVEGEAADKYMK